MRAVLPLVCQFGRFLLVGTTNAAVSLCVDLALLRVGMYPVAAAGAAFAAGAINGYALNRRWTFAAADCTRGRICYAFVQLSGLLLTMGLVAGIESLARPDHLLAYVAAAAPVTVATFVANRSWTFSTTAAG